MGLGPIQDYINNWGITWDVEEYKKQMLSATISREEFAKARWAKVDLTPAFRKFNVKPKGEKRQLFGLVGHLADIVKIMTPVTLAKHKMSPAVQTVESLVSRTDWKGDRFKTVREMWVDGIGEGIVADDRFNPRDPDGWLGGASQLLAASMYNARQSLPIPLSEMLVGLQGESSMISAVSKAGGLDIRDTKLTDPNEKIFWQKTQEINRLVSKKADAQALKDSTLKAEAKQEIEDYPNFNRTKARLGYTRVQLRHVNKTIRALLLKQDKLGLSPFETRKLREKIKRKEEIYRKFVEVVNR